jgi:hypothetical protein
MESTGGAGRGDGSRLPVAFAAGALVVVLLAGGLVLLTHSTRSHTSAAAARFPFGPQEQAYAGRVHFLDIQMARSTNMLNQEFTYVAGTISNDGDRTLRGLEVSVEFRDPFDQVILRETERLIGSGDAPLGGGQKQAFQVTLEHVPVEWNRQYPAIKATGLILE